MDALVVHGYNIKRYREIFQPANLIMVNVFAPWTDSSFEFMPKRDVRAWLSQPARGIWRAAPSENLRRRSIAEAFGRRFIQSSANLDQLRIGTDSGSTSLDSLLRARLLFSITPFFVADRDRMALHVHSSSDLLRRSAIATWSSGGCTGCQAPRKTTPLTIRSTVICPP